MSDLGQVIQEIQARIKALDLQLDDLIKRVAALEAAKPSETPGPSAPVA